MTRAATTRGRTALVLGMGVTGLSLVRYLQGRGYRLTVMDSRAEPPALAALGEIDGLTLLPGQWRADLLLQTDLVAVSPGVAADQPALMRARQAGIEVVGDVELFARATRKPVAAITGTNGKSTVTSLLGAILTDAGRDVAVGGNLGTPALDLLAQRPRDGFVLELSSFQLDLTERLRPACAAILNVTADHLDRYPDLSAYAASKQRIYRHARSAVYNADDALTIPPADFGGRRTAVQAGPARDGWGLACGVDRRQWLIAEDRPLLPVDELPMAGRHNAFNVLCALAMAAQLGVEPEQALLALRRFQPLPHRCTVVGCHRGVRYVDDSKATNVGACLAAIEGLRSSQGGLVVIAGGVGKGADFSALRPAFREAVKAAVLIGEDAPALHAALADVCDVQRADDMSAAVQMAATLADEGDTVLLAPACASFDMYRSYAERGEAFVTAVRRLQGGSS